MSKLSHILIEVRNLTDQEQVKLWHTLWKFADEQVRDHVKVMCYAIPKKAASNSNPQQTASHKKQQTHRMKRAT